MKYCKTDDTLADALTKPLQGKRFARMRDALLGITKMKDARALRHQHVSEVHAFAKGV